MPIVIASEFPFNTNTSITNISERLAAEVLHRYLPGQHELARAGAPPFIWVEHYPGDRSFPERFSLVTYSTWIPYERAVGARLTRPSFGAPSWEHVDQTRLEELLGQAWRPESVYDYGVPQSAASGT